MNTTSGPRSGAAEDDGKHRASPDKPRRRKHWIAALVLVAVALVVAVVLLPTLLSTSPGNRTLLGLVNRQIPGSVDAERIRVGWLHGPRITNLTLLDRQGELVADLPRLAAPQAQPLWLAMGSRRFGDIDIHARGLHVRQEAGQPTNLQLALMRDPDPDVVPDPPDPARVDPDTSARVQFSADRITYEAPDIDPVELSDVRALLDVTDVQNIGVDLRSALRHNDVDGRIDAELRLTDMFTELGELQWQRGGIAADVELVNLPVDAVDRLMQQDGRLALLLGPQLNAEVHTEGPIDAMTARITARSEHLTVDAQLQSDERAITSPGAELALTMTPTAFRAWAELIDPTDPPELLEPVTTRMQLASLHVPRRDGTLVLEEAAIDATASMDDVLLRVLADGAVATDDGAAGDTAEPMQIGLHGTSLTLRSDALDELVQVQLQSEAAYTDVRERVQASVQVRGALGEAVDRELALAAEALPVVLADAIGGLEGRLAETLGPTLDVQLSASQPAAQQIAFNAAVGAERLAGAMRGAWDLDAQEGSLETVEPLRLMLTPRAYAMWVGELGAQMVLAEPMTAAVRLNVPRLGLREPADDEPMDPLALIDPQRTTLEFSLASPRIVMEDPTTRERVAMDRATIVAPRRSLDQALEVLVQMRIQDLADAQREPPAAAVPEGADDADAPDEQFDPTARGAVEARTQLHEIVGANGRLDPTQARVVADLTVNQIPSRVVDMLAQQEGQLAAVLGARTSANAHVDYQRQHGGTARAELRTTNAAADFDAAIDPEGRARLTRDTTLSVAVTDDVSEVMLSRFNPLLAHVIAAEAPVQVHLYQENFVVPIDPFVWDTVSLDGRLDMPTFTLRAAGFLDAAFHAMRAVGALPLGRTYTANISPTDFRVRDGVLSYDELDIALARDMHLTFGGQVNLDTLAVRMDMRFDGDAYPREMRGLALPLRGTVDDPNLDTDRIGEVLVRRGIQRGVGELLRRNNNDDEDEDEDRDQRPSPLRDIFDRIR